VEVASGVRRGISRGALTDERAHEVMLGYVHLPLARHGHLPLLTRIVELRHNFSAYDATYVALAERLGAALVTTDAPFGRAVSSQTALEVVP